MDLELKRIQFVRILCFWHSLPFWRPLLLTLSGGKDVFVRNGVTEAAGSVNESLVANIENPRAKGKTQLSLGLAVNNRTLITRQPVLEGE